jgi:hypothetical protein
LTALRIRNRFAGDYIVNRPDLKTEISVSIAVPSAMRTPEELFYALPMARGIEALNETE